MKRGPIFSEDMRAADAGSRILVALIGNDALDGYFDGATISNLADLNRWVDPYHYINRMLNTLEARYGWSKNHLADYIVDAVNETLAAHPIVSR